MVFKQEFRDTVTDPSIPVPFKARPGVEFTTTTDPKSGSQQFFAKDRATGEVYRLGAEEMLICQLLDGSRSFDDIGAAFKERFGQTLSRKQFATCLRELDASGFLVGAHSPTQPSAPHVIAPEPQIQATPAGPMQWPLFDPTPLLSMLAWFFRPTRYLLWLLPPATLLAGLILFHRRYDLVLEHRILELTTAALAAAGLATLVLCNLFVRIAQGVVAHASGAAVRQFGVAMIAGVIPSFYIDRRTIHSLPHRARIWCHAAPLLARLTLFVLGTFLWISLRKSGTALSEVGFFVGQVGFWSLVISSIPFLPTDGYLLISSIFDRPDYMDRAFRVLGMQVTGRSTPQALRRRDKWLLILFAGAVVICMAAAAAGGVLLVGAPLEEHFRGAGVTLFVAAFALAVLWSILSWRTIGRVRASAKAAAASRPNVVPLAAGTAARSAAAPQPATRYWHAPKSRRRYLPYAIWVTILGALGYVAFLPYPYEAGGDFQVLPSTRVEVRARVDGEVIEVLVKEGDLVEQGQPLARLSSWDKVRDLATAKASLDKSEAELRVLKEGPKPEEIALAESEVAAARARITFSRAEADRYSQLVKSGTASKRDAERASSEYRKDLADLAVAEANLTKVKSGPTASMVAASSAEVVKFREQVSYLEDQIERAVVRATMAGRIVTPNIDLERGMYLTVGTLFATIEQSQIAQGEILVPETDIAEIQLGDMVRLKPWGNSNIEINGEVVAISPTAVKTPYGPVVHVKTNIDNADGFLRPDMTGYAKIEGSEMPVWEAYTRLFVRFFNIEVWSWIP